jgi:flagellar motor switch protein FliM
VEAEQLKFRVLATRTPPPFIHVDTETNRGKMIFCLEPRLGEILIDGALGGRLRTFSGVLNLTAIEKVVLREILSEIFQECQQIFGGIVKISLPAGEIFRQNPQEPTFLEDDYLFLVTLLFHFSDGNPAGRLFLGYGDEVLKPLLESLGQIGNNGEARKVLLNEKTLAQIAVPVKSELGGTVLTTGELAKIRLGDVISLDKKAGSPVKLVVGEQVQLVADLGVSEEHLALKLKGQGFSGEKPRSGVIEEEIRRNFSEVKKNEIKEGGGGMVSEKYFGNEMAEYELEENQNVEKDSGEFYDETGSTEEPATEEEEAEDYGFSLDEE